MLFKKRKTKCGVAVRCSLATARATVHYRGVRLSLLTLTSMLLLLFPHITFGQTRRIVILKVDGLQHDMVDRFVGERNPRTGKSQLPWIDHVFYQNGSRLENFYTRGVSLSGPSWGILDTGQHAQIKGNVEFDRYTLHTYDYLNFIPYYLAYVAHARVDMPGAEMMDEMGTPLLMDAYPFDERYMGFQLYQRGTRWTTLQRGLQNRFTTRSPRELIDEWTMGIEGRNIIMDQLERELLEKLRDPRIRYLDYYTTEFDHSAHHNRDAASHLLALKELDALVGRIWSAIQKTPQADETAMLMVSDHGINTDERVYSQGFNLVKLFGSAEGGGHHVITKRRLLLDYSIKGFYPLVPLITTTTENSYYLKGQSTIYPTVLVDFDGNERASIHLRDSDLNVLHILLQQLQRKDITESQREALKEAFFQKLDSRRRGWEADVEGLKQELEALNRWIADQRGIIASQPKKWTKADSDAGRDLEARRVSARVNSSVSDELEYVEYLCTLQNLLALRREGFDPRRIKIEDVIAKNGMGTRNTIHELQNYVVGISPEGLEALENGTLDMQRSFKRVDYFSLLHDASVRNNVQPGVSARPVDFIAVRIPRREIAPSLKDDLQSDGDPLWLYGGEERQALILSRTDRRGRLMLRYLPITKLKQDESGRIRFEVAPLGAGFPLKIFEDAQLELPESARSRTQWLSEWHAELDWLRALHRTEYSNGLIGVHEQLSRHPAEKLDLDAPGISTDERLLRRYRVRQRELAEADLLVLANNHWNFDVRGFNPGGNHGSFFRVSTQSTLMLAGGPRTGIPRAARITEPYDGLSFMPTVMALTGQIADGRTPVPVLWQRGFRTFPGRIIKEVLGTQEDNVPSPVARGEADAP